jgi:hypothetical protein
MASEPTSLEEVDTGMARLGLGVLITLAITFGLFAATAVTGAQIPVEEPSQLPSLAEHALCHPQARDSIRPR